MESIIADNVTIMFDSGDKPTADLFAEICAKSVPVIYDTLGLTIPPKCKVYVMTSWQKFLLHSAPWYRKILLLIIFPFYYFKINREWSKIAGWSLPYQPTIGVKAPALFASQDTEIGKKIYNHDPDLYRKIRGYLCHELVHACSYHLKLPLWLNEGIAMYTVDKFLGIQTVKSETLEFLNAHPHKSKLLNYRNLMSASIDDIAYNYVRGYWITKLLERNYPDFLRTLLQKPQKEHELVRLISDKLNIHQNDFWNRIDQKIVSTFTS
jgi:hypothetical protein